MALCPDAWSASNVLQFLILFITNSQHGSIWYPTGAFLCSTTKTSHDYQPSRISKNTTCSNKHKLCISILIGQFINNLQCKSLKTICIRHVLYCLISVNTNINLHDAKLSCRDIVWATTSQTRACLTVRAAFQHQMMIIFPPTRERLQQSPSKHRTWKVFLLKVETMRQKTQLSTISLCRRAASSCWCAMQTYTNDSTKHDCSTQKLESIWREKQTVHGNHWCSNMEVTQGFNQLVRKCHPQRGFFFFQVLFCSNKTGVLYFYLKFPGKILAINYYTIILLLAPF